MNYLYVFTFIATFLAGSVFGMENDDKGYQTPDDQITYSSNYPTKPKRHKKKDVYARFHSKFISFFEPKNRHIFNNEAKLKQLLEDYPTEFSIICFNNPKLVIKKFENGQVTSPEIENIIKQNSDNCNYPKSLLLQRLLISERKSMYVMGLHNNNGTDIKIIYTTDKKKRTIAPNNANNKAKRTKH